MIFGVNINSLITKDNKQTNNIEYDENELNLDIDENKLVCSYTIGNTLKMASKLANKTEAAPTLLSIASGTSTTTGIVQTAATLATTVTKAASTTTTAASTATTAVSTVTTVATTAGTTATTAGTTATTVVTTTTKVVSTSATTAGYVLGFVFLGVGIVVGVSSGAYFTNKDINEIIEKLYEFYINNAEKISNSYKLVNEYLEFRANKELNEKENGA